MALLHRALLHTAFIRVLHLLLFDCYMMETISDEDSGGQYRLLRAAIIRAAFLVCTAIPTIARSEARRDVFLSVLGVVERALGGDVLNDTGKSR